MPPRKLITAEAAIVDLDGTLVDTLGDFEEALARVSAELGLPAPGRAAIERRVGKGSEHLIRSVLAYLHADPSLYDAAWEAYQRHYAAINGRHSRVYPGAAEGLRRLSSAGLRLACLTNKPTGFAQALLAQKGLADAFERVIGGDAFERKKPDPLPVLKTCEALGSPPARTVLIGDSSNDARAARAAGCPVLLVSYGYNHGEPVRGVDADGLLESIEEALDWISPDGPAARP